MKTEDKNIDTGVLTDEEVNFCLLYVNAPAPLAGNATECYWRVYRSAESEDDSLSRAKAAYAAKKLLKKQAIQDKIAELEEINLYDSASLKQRITTTMLKIMDECSEGEYVDRYGKALSPAALRSASISAAKMIADINGIKEETVHKIQIGDTEGHGITFNVIVPESKDDTPTI